MSFHGREKRVATLQRRVSVGFRGQSTRVAGSCHFFFGDSSNGPWRHEVVTTRDPKYSQTHKFVCLRCTTCMSAPKQFKGVMAMVCQRDNRWRLCVLSKHTTKDTLGFYVDELGAVSPALPIKIKYTRLFFVCLFCRDGTLDSLKNPARVNPIDGCLEASITPSVVDYRVFRHPLPETPRG